MIMALMVYALFVGSLICVAALLAERVTVIWGLARRFVWIVALMLSLLLPPALVLLRSAAAAPRSGGPVNTVYLASGVPVLAGKGLIVAADPSPRQWAVVRNLDRIAGLLWLSASLALAMWRVAAWTRLRWHARHWPRAVVGGHAVWISDDLGPAVFGFLRPRIVMPRWVADGPSGTHTAIVAHELEHVRARDPLLVLLGLAAVCVAPWNLLLWWQLRRLRFAAEIDCDARVLNRGVALADYAAALVWVGRRGRAALITAMALGGRRSELKRRVDIMTVLPKRTLPLAFACGVAAVSVVAAATALDAPVIGSQTDSQQEPAPSAVPDLRQLQRTVRALHPWLFDSKIAGTVIIRVLMQPSGWIDKTDAQTVPRKIDATKASPVLSDFSRLRVRSQDLAKVGVVQMPVAGANHNNVLIAYAVLKETEDPSGDRALVEMAVRRKYPALFAADSLATMARVKIVMNRDGTAARAFMGVEILRTADGRVIRDDPALGTNEGNLEERFGALGLKPKDIDSDGEFSVIVNPVLPNRVVIDYAWPIAGAQNP
jgi:beta-lactamase regulating signal transducer with metallopeptidase domain